METGAATICLRRLTHSTLQEFILLQKNEKFFEFMMLAFLLLPTFATCVRHIIVFPQGVLIILTYESGTAWGSRAL